MAYDPVHHQTVLFGGVDGGGVLTNQTWVYDGTTWTNVTPSLPSSPNPSARLWASMAFDPISSTMLLFGGCSTATCGPYLNDTWSWNGTAWTQLHPSANPGIRRGAAMAYSPTSSNAGIVLYGGFNNGVPLADMFVWDGVNWNTIGVTTPPAREFASISYDYARQRLVMFGGDNGSTPVNETWLWNGTSWALAAPAASPSARSNQGQVWDPTRQLTVMFGGNAQSDTWTWDGGTWTQETTAASPQGRSYVAMAYDTQHAQSVIFGGLNGTPLGDTWTLGYVYQQSWVQVDAANDPTAPSARLGASAVLYNNAVLMFGGWDGTKSVNDTWTYSGREWALATSGASPPARNLAAMTYDAAHGFVVLFGGETGITGTGLLGDTWTFANGTWAQLSISGSPLARNGAAMAYDAAHKNVVMFGGSGAGNGNDTWLFTNGNTWSQLAPNTTPPGRGSAAMVFDYTRNQIVMFGGSATGTGTPLNDTWVWDGGNWTQMTPANSPPGREGATMVYDSVHGTVLLYGGQQFNDLNDTWQWDGVNWTQLNPPSNAPALVNAAAAFLPTSGFFTFGGQSGAVISGQAWTFASPYTTTILPVSFAGQPYFYSMPSAGGIPNYTFSDDQVPTPLSNFNLAIDGSGNLQGSPNLATGQKLSFGITLADGQGQSSDLSVMLVGDSPITFTPNPPIDATAGATYSYQLSATGGSSPFTFTVQGGPAWLSVNGSNQLTATNCTAGDSSLFTLVAQDSLGGTASSGTLFIDCNPAPLITNSSPLPGAAFGVAYSTQLQTNAMFDSPGAPPFTWALVPGSVLPAGLTLTSSGAISGTPTSVGNDTFTVKFTDAWSATTSKTFQLAVAINVTAPQLPTGNVGIKYPTGIKISASGGTNSYTFQAANLPAGLVLNAITGVISGTPTTQNTYSTVFTVTDTASNTGTLAVTMFVVQPGTNPEDWVQLAPANSPALRSAPATFYDSVRSKLILFGGGGPTFYGDTESWDGTTWTNVSKTGPSARSGAAAAFDPVHQVGVLFGGQNTFGFQNDTWLWNGTAWTQVLPAHSPAGRFDAVMVWDGTHIMLFGGNIGDGDFGDTWIWDGTDWTQITVTPSPSNRAEAAAAYDPVHHVVVMFGGFDGGEFTDFNETWFWDGAAESWSLAGSTLPPSARDSMTMAFDPIRSQIVMFGGLATQSNSYLSDTYAWNGGFWTPLGALHHPSPRGLYGMAFDTATSNLVLFGGQAQAGGSPVAQSDTWVLEGPFITNTVLPPGSFGVAYSATPPLTSGIAPLTFIDANSPPSWISIGAATGTFTGTPNASGTSVFDDIVIDNFGVSSTAHLTLTISPPPLQLTPTTLPNATAQADYNVQLKATGGTPGYTFSAQNLPAGLSINASNQIAGQCTGNSNKVILKVTDAGSNTSTVGPLSVTCNAFPAILTNSPLPDGATNVPYTTTIQMSGGTPGITWSLVQGNLPNSFTIDQNGVLSGTTSSPVLATFSVTVQDFWKATVTKQFQLNIASSFNITTTQLALGNLGLAYPPGQAIAVSGAVGTVTFGASNLPPGLLFNTQTGAITGTPTKPGSYTPTFTASDQGSNSSQQTFPIVVAQPGTNTQDWVQLAPAHVPALRGAASMFYDSTRNKLIMFGGNNNGTSLNDTESWDGANWTTLAPAASPGARYGAAAAYDPIHQVGVLFGGQSNFNTVLGETWLWNGTTWTQANPASSPGARTNAMLAWDGTHIVMYGGSLLDQSLSDTWIWDGTTWTQVNTTTPPARESAGMSYDPLLNQVVLFGGSPIGSPTYLSDTWLWNGASETWAQVLPAHAPTARAFVSMSYDAAHSNTVLFGGFAPPNTNLNDTWTWNGTDWTQLNTVHSPLNRYFYAMSYDPATASVVLFGGQTGNFLNDTWILDGPAALNTLLPNGTQGLPYSSPSGISGGIAPMSFTSGSLPPGLTLNSSTGVFGGTPTGGGPYTFPVDVQDAWGVSIVPQFNITIDVPLVLTPAVVPDATQSTDYNLQLGATGGIPPYTFSVTGLPNGLTFNAQNQIVGQCTAASNQVILRVFDDGSSTVTRGPLTINCNTLPTLNTTSPLPSGVVGTQYTEAFQMSGGTAPITWTLGSNTLPNGFKLSSGGVLTGTASAPATATLDVTVSDLWKATFTRTYTLNIYPVLSITTAQLPDGEVGVPYQTGVSIVAAGGTGKGTYHFTATGLPTGFSIDSSTGTISGSTQQSGQFQPTFHVTDQDAQVAQKQINLNISVPASGLFFQTASPLPPATPNVAYTTTIQPGGGNGIFTLNATGLPNWLSFNTTTGVLSGTPPSAGPVTFKITVSDTAEQSLTESFTLPVNGTLTFGSVSPLPPASVGLPYSDTLSASGGSGGYTWTAAGLPAWLSLSAGGVLSGNPPQAGTVTMRVTVTDSQNHALSRTFILPVHSALTIDTVSPLPPATTNFPYTATFAASGGAGNYQWSATTELPGGFTFSTAGVLLGTATSAGPITFTAKVTDSLQNTATLNVTLPVNSAVTLNTTTLPPATTQVPYAANLTASGGVPGYTFTATGLPAWLSLSAAGYLSGTPPNPGTVNLQVTVTDSQTTATTTPVSLTINPALSITTLSLPVGTVNVAYSTNLAAAGGVGPYTWSANNLPNGLSITQAGTLSGTIAQAGPYSVPVTVWDSETSIASHTFTLLISTGLPLSFGTAANLPNCTVGALCSNQIVPSGGIPPYTFSLSGKPDLDGLSFSAGGLLSGIPIQSGNVSVPVILSDQVSNVSQTFTQPVISTLAISPGNLPNGTVGVQYGSALTASGGQGILTWSLAPGSAPLPQGLNLLAQGGNIVGIPTTPGTSTFSVQVSDGHQTSAPQQFTITIAAVPIPLTINSPANLAPGTVGVQYSQALLAAGGSNSYTWSLTQGSLPDGLSLSPAGGIAGTPTTAGSFTFTATVNDAPTDSRAAQFTIVVAGSGSPALITPNPLPNGSVGIAYSYAIQVLGGSPPYFYSITAGQVPPGLTFDAANGVITGTPSLKGAFGIVLNVTDSSGAAVGVQGKAKPRAVASSNYTIKIAGPGDFEITTPQNLPPATMGVFYSTTLAASGGASPYTWSLVQGNLPAGLILSAAGTISGVAGQAGQAPLVIQATDSKGVTTTGAFLLDVVNPNIPEILPFPPPPPGTVSQAYTASLVAAGGHVPYTWSVAQGQLPAGLSLNAQNGGIVGTPTQTGSFPFTVRIVDNNQVGATQQFTIRVNALTLNITPVQIPAATANAPYSLAPAVTGGTPPYNWSLSAGGLLSGFAINPATGAITGTPTTPGTYPFTISVVDSNFGLARQTYQLVVQAPPPPAISISTASVPAGTVGVSYDFGLQAANSTPPLTWSSTGTLPPGIQLVADSGLLIGTPTTAGSYTFTATVTDSTPASAQATFTLVVSPKPLSVVTATLSGGGLGTAYKQTVQSLGGTGAITWTVSSGALPGGLSLDSGTGIISGTPTAQGTFNFTIQAKDSTGVTAQQAYTIVIGGPPSAPAVTLSGLPATSKPGDQPTVTITLANPYPLPITVTATLSISPSPGNASDLMFPNGTRTTQITIPANSTTATLQFQVGSLAGTISISLSMSAAGVNITPSVPPSANTSIAASAPVISSVAATVPSGQPNVIQVVVTGVSTTRDMQTAVFTFTPAAGANLQSSTFQIDVSSLFKAWYASAASAATGSQFALTVPFTIGGNVSSIASVSVTLTNSAGTSASVSANVK